MEDLQEYEYAFPILSTYTVPILYVEWDRDAGKTLHRIGTGVLVKIADKLVVATAAHCIHPCSVVMNERECNTVPQNPDQFVPSHVSKIRIVRRERHASLDIGLLELVEDEAVAALGKSYCSLGQANPLPLLPGFYHIMGYPIYGIIWRGNTAEFVQQAFAVPFQEERDGHYLFPFPEKGWTHGFPHDDAKEEKYHPTPEGFSGGGVWGFVQSDPKELYSPEKHVKLMAIQCSWYVPPHRLIRCVPIALWLRLVRQTYPDLNDVVATAFPSISISGA